MTSKKISRPLLFIMIAVGLIVLVTVIAAISKGTKLSGSAAQQQEEMATICYNSPEASGWIIIQIPLSQLEYYMSHGGALPTPDCPGPMAQPTPVPTDPPPPTPEPANIIIVDSCNKSSAIGGKLWVVGFRVTNNGGNSEVSYTLTRPGKDPRTSTFTMVHGRSVNINETSAGGSYTLTVTYPPNGSQSATRQCP